MYYNSENHSRTQSNGQCLINDQFYLFFLLKKNVINNIE